MRKSSFINLGTVIALLTAATLGCDSLTPDIANKSSGSNSGRAYKVAASGTVVNSTDNKAQVTVPSGWEQTTGLNAMATLQVANKPQEMYLVVVVNNKEDFPQLTLDKSSETTRANLVANMANPQVSAPTHLMINGYPAVQHEISGMMTAPGVNAVNIVYLHTSIETPKRFDQLLAWTLKSHYEDNRAVLQKIINSFREKQ